VRPWCGTPLTTGALSNSWQAIDLRRAPIFGTATLCPQQPRPIKFIEIPIQLRFTETCCQKPSFKYPITLLCDAMSVGAYQTRPTSWFPFASRQCAITRHRIVSCNTSCERTSRPRTGPYPFIQPPPISRPPLHVSPNDDLSNVGDSANRPVFKLPYVVAGALQRVTFKIVSISTATIFENIEVMIEVVAKGQYV
jgi:hypothetical protein